MANNMMQSNVDAEVNLIIGVDTHAKILHCQIVDVDSRQAQSS